MKYVLMAAIVLTLAGCKDERPTSFSGSGRDFQVECIDGVQYWYRNAGHSGYMAARIDPETLTFVRCEGNQ